MWNSQAADLWGLRADEVTGNDFLAVDIGLPTEGLRRPLRDTLAGNTELETIELDAITRRGRSVRCRVSITPLHSDGTASGAMLVMEIIE